MAPSTSNMTAEESLGPWALRPAGEVMLMSKYMLKEEFNSCNQGVMSNHTNNLPEDDAAVTDSLCTEEPFCRICHEGSASGQLLSPCDCSGSLAMVHRACLEHWLMTSNSSHCELCHHKFTLDRQPKPLTEHTSQSVGGAFLASCFLHVGRPAGPHVPLKPLSLRARLDGVSCRSEEDSRHLLASSVACVATACYLLIKHHVLCQVKLQTEQHKAPVRDRYTCTVKQVGQLAAEPVT